MGCQSRDYVPGCTGDKRNKRRDGRTAVRFKARFSHMRCRNFSKASLSLPCSKEIPANQESCGMGRLAQENCPKIEVQKCFSGMQGISLGSDPNCCCRSSWPVENAATRFTYRRFAEKQTCSNAARKRAGWQSDCTMPGPVGQHARQERTGGRFCSPAMIARAQRRTWPIFPR